MILFIESGVTTEIPSCRSRHFRVLGNRQGMLDLDRELLLVHCYHCRKATILSLSSAFIILPCLAHSSIASGIPHLLVSVMDFAFSDCVVAAMLSRLDYKPGNTWAVEVPQPRLTSEIVAVDEARLVSQAAKTTIDRSVAYRCLRLARQDVQSIVGVHWVPPPVMVEVLLAPY